MTNFELRFAEDESLVSLSKSFQRNGPIFSVVNFLPLSLIFKIFCYGAISLKFVMKVRRKLHPSPFKRKKKSKKDLRHEKFLKIRKCSCMDKKKCMQLLDRKNSFIQSFLFSRQPIFSHIENANRLLES